MSLLSKLECFLFFTFSMMSQTFDIDEFYPVEQRHSSIRFAVSYMGVGQVTGNFKSFQGTVRFNEDQPELI